MTKRRRSKPVVLSVDSDGSQRIAPLETDAERSAFIGAAPLAVVGGALAMDEELLSELQRIAAGDGDVEELACRFSAREGSGRDFMRWALGQAVEAARRAEPIGTHAAIERAKREGLTARRAAQFRLLNLVPVVVVEEKAVAVSSEAEFEAALASDEGYEPAERQRRWRGPGLRHEAAEGLLSLGMGRCLLPGCATQLAVADARAKVRWTRHYCSAHSKYERIFDEVGHDNRMDAVEKLLAEAAAVRNRASTAQAA